IFPAMRRSAETVGFPCALCLLPDDGAPRSEFPGHSCHASRLVVCALPCLYGCDVAAAGSSASSAAEYVSKCSKEDSHTPARGGDGDYRSMQRLSAYSL